MVASLWSGSWIASQLPLNQIEATVPNVRKIRYVICLGVRAPSPAQSSVALPRGLPQSKESVRIQSRVAHCVLNLFVPEVVLDQTQVATFVGEVVTAAVAQQMRVRLHRKFGALSRPVVTTRQNALRLMRSPRSDLNARIPCLLLPQPQQSLERHRLDPLERMHARARALGARAIDRTALEIDVAPAQPYDLARAQPVSVRDHNHRVIARAMTALFGGAQEHAPFHPG